MASSRPVTTALPSETVGGRFRRRLQTYSVTTQAATHMKIT